MRYRNADTRLLQSGQQSGKQQPLLIVVCGHGFAGCEMTEKTFQCKMTHCPDVPDQIHGLGVHGSAAPHACIDFHVDGQCTGGFFELLFEGAYKCLVGDGGGKVVFYDIGNFREGGRPQNDDGRFNAADPKLNAFIGICHAKHPGAFAQGGMGNLNGSVAIRIGLDGLHEIDRAADQPFDFPEIGGKIVQVHFHPAAVFLLVSQCHFLVITNTPSQGGVGGCCFRFLHLSIYIVDTKSSCFILQAV